jgi:anti-sigma-K factor RskA
MSDIPASSSPCHAGRWRAATIACILLIAFGLAAGASMYEQFKAQVAHLQAQVKATPRIKYIAVLLDTAQEPAMLATFDPQERAMQLQRLNTVKEGREDTLQLWALVPGAPPRSLGVLYSAGKTHQLPASDAALATVSQLAISVEDKGGAATDRGPRLPYLFSGALVQKAL